MKLNLPPLAQLVAAVSFFFIFQNSVAQNANRSLSNLTTPTAVNVTLLPARNNNFDLGSASLTWRNIYAGTSYYIGASRALDISGSANTFVGNSGASNTTGNSNTATGYQALNSTNTGYANTAIGVQTLYSITNSFHNVAVGYQALLNATTSAFNVAIGSGTLFSTTSGSWNTAIGYQTLYANTTGYDNTVTGYYAMPKNTSGSSNTASGFNAMLNNITGNYNAAFGQGALLGNNADYNTGIGTFAMSGNTTGYYNTGVGFGSLGQTVSSWGNTAIGFYAGNSYNNGYYNTFVGAETRANSADIYNSTALGRGTIVTAPSQIRLGNSSVTSIGGYANWTNISDGRVKKNIKTNVPGLDFINKLQPITYNLDLAAEEGILKVEPIKDTDGNPIRRSKEDETYRREKEQIIYTGFVAQDVEKAAKEIDYDFSGVDAAKNEKGLYGLRYADFVVPLVKAVQELSAENEELKRRLSDLEELIAGNKKPLTSAKLEQNVPNPADGGCNIGYFIPSDSHHAQLVLTDAVGRTLKTYSISATGFGKQIINRSELSSGMYQYSLIIDGKVVETKKMIMTR